MAGGAVEQGSSEEEAAGLVVIVISSIEVGIYVYTKAHYVMISGISFGFNFQFATLR
jgi:hypothetical protein